MRLCIVFLICSALPGILTQDNDDDDLNFPEGFTLGAGGSAYQIEGGWNASDKGESIWDRFLHNQPDVVIDGSNGDVACDFYHKYKEDVQLMKGMGLDHYRLSISWSRVLPTGFANQTSEEGLRFYHNVIDELLANNIEPLVLLYHWDHPQSLEDLGGWLNEMMVTWFAEYADVIFREFGSKVKVFTTLNEPKVFCFFQYVKGNHAPAKMLNTSAAFTCGHNALKAHARAYHLYDRQYRPKQNGKIGIATVCSSYYPRNANESFATEIGFQFDCGWIAHPIFVGDYPELFKSRIEDMSKEVGLTESMLPKFSPKWIKYIKNTSDYFGLNHYSSIVVEFGVYSDLEKTSYMPDGIGIKTGVDPAWESASSKWLHIVPQGLRKLLRRIKKDYNSPSVYIFENGLSDDGRLDDYQRIKYIYSYLKELLLAVHRDDCDVKKYTVWSLMDNFEWIKGYNKESFGLVHVNFSTPNLERTPKLSATWLKKMMLARKLQPPILPDQ